MSSSKSSSRRLMPPAPQAHDCAQRDVAQGELAPQPEEHVGALREVVGHGGAHCPSQATVSVVPLRGRTGVCRSARVASASTAPFASSATR